VDFLLQLVELYFLGLYWRLLTLKKEQHFDWRKVHCFTNNKKHYIVNIRAHLQNEFVIFILFTFVGV
jgi:hypothetical protein